MSEDHPEWSNSDDSLANSRRIAREVMEDLKSGRITRVGGETIEEACDKAVTLREPERSHFITRTTRAFVALCV